MKSPSTRLGIMPLEAFSEERRCSIGDTDNLVSGLPIEFEVEFSPRPAVIPVRKLLELAASHGPLREPRSLDRDAHARCLACDAALLRNGFGVSDNAARNEALTTFILALEHESRVTCGDQLAAIHRLVGRERECPCPPIDDRCFNRIRHDLS